MENALRKLCNSGIMDPDDVANQDIVADDWVLMYTGGVPCIDCSAMSNCAQGDGGTTMLATSTMMSEIKRSDPQPDLGYVECNHRWNSSILADACPQHKTAKMILQGEDHGDIYSRPRGGTLSTSGRLQFMEPLENFLATTGSKVHPLCKASDLWSASDSEQELELLELCKKRVVPVGVPAEELTWNDVLLPTQKARRQGYEELFEQRVQAGRAKHDDDWWCDLEQNHDGPRSKLHVDSSVHSRYKPLNTLITHQTLWHGTRQTVMCATDQAVQ